MLYLVGCKDQAIAKQLEGSLYQRLKKNFAHMVQDFEKIHIKHKTDANGCWTDMSKHIEKLTADAESTKKYHDCWGTKGVPDPKTLKEKCH